MGGNGHRQQLHGRVSAIVVQLWSGKKTQRIEQLSPFESNIKKEEHLPCHYRAARSNGSEALPYRAASD